MEGCKYTTNFLIFNGLFIFVVMQIRKSTIADIPRLMEIFREARQKMLDSGNLHQWKPGHPTREMILADIAAGVSYAITDDDGTITGTFAFIPGKDPTYATVYGGEWIDDSLPYGTIHRLAGAEGAHGIAQTCFGWCWERIRNLRVDTHEDNVIMRRCIEKAGFRYCGVIHLLNGDPRLAFQKIEEVV